MADPCRSPAVAAAALAAVAFAGAAQAGRIAALPSPVAPLSSAPPLAGGAVAAHEGVHHRVSAQTVVRISVDPSGAPFAVTATQRLDVRVIGDFFFTIGAPLVDVEATAGSEEVPGLRTDAIVWAGFNPDRRVLAARATLDAPRVRPVLPLRIEETRDTVTLVNSTRTTTTAYAADAVRRPLLEYLRRLVRGVGVGRPPRDGTALLTSRATAERLQVTAPLRVVGTIGGKRVSAILGDRLVVHGSGPVDVRVTPVAPTEVPGASSLRGRALLHAVVVESLTAARVRQYDTFLGNPDPTGRSATTFVYRTATEIVAARAAAVTPKRHDWERSALLFSVLALATIAAFAVWARS
jgi:hypothetical protein